MPSLLDRLGKVKEIDKEKVKLLPDIDIHPDTPIKLTKDQVKTAIKEVLIEPKKIKKIEEIPGEDELFGIRFYGWFAKAKKIPYYSNMKLSQLKLKIGLKLIEESGLKG